MRGYLIQVIWLTSIMCHAADPDNDEKRPYEFGFTIDGEQHRYEKKDEKGIIMGEFGFITADGIYHVTVYATDENGDFKIISMKNIKVGFPPGKTTTTTEPYPKSNSLLNGLRGCSGCLIPESSPTTAPKGYPPNSKAFVTKDPIDERNSFVNKGTQSSSSFDNIPKNRIDAKSKSKTVPPNYQEYGREQQKKHEQLFTAKPIPNTSVPNNTPSQINIAGSHNTTKPSTNGFTPNVIPNQITNVPSKAKSHPQLNEMEMKILNYMAKLYKFNYTLSFHGHEETGDVGGNKNGSYFSNGRDGYQRKVIYVANEFGYQPKISLVKLEDESIPKEATEKELTKLKGREFIWFYRKK